MIGSLDGDTVLQAGQQYQQEASTVSSPRGHTLIAGQSVTITAGEQPYTEGYQRRDKRSGLTVAVNVPIVDAVRAIQHAAESIGEVVIVARKRWRQRMRLGASMKRGGSSHGSACGNGRR